MSNMKYCAFENTSRDLEQVIKLLEENDWDLEDMRKNASSNHEARAMSKLIEQCKTIAGMFE